MKNVLILTFCLLFVACTNIREVSYTGVKGFKVNTISTTGINGDIMLGIKNPNDFGFSIYKSAFDVTYSGIYLGKAKLTKKVYIHGNAEETYAFNLVSDFKNMTLADVMKLLQGATGRSKLEVKGILRVGRFLIRKKFPVQLEETLRLQ